MTLVFWSNNYIYDNPAVSCGGLRCPAVFRPTRFWGVTYTMHPTIRLTHY